MHGSRPLPVLLLARHAQIEGTEQALRSRHHRGELARVRRGVYVASSELDQLTIDERYILRIHATAQSISPRSTFSHDSAAAIWGLPTIGPWSTRIHVTDGITDGGRSRGEVHRHSLPADEHATVLGGVRVTSLARTLVDIACSTDFARSVAMIDATLARTSSTGISRDSLLRLLEELKPRAGSRKGQAAIEFADGRSDSPLESLSRVQMRMLGLPAPQLQVPFHDRDGLIGIADFYWPELGLVGEADGAAKYSGTNSPSGDEAGAVVLREKRREDRLRAVTRRFARWGWTDATERHRIGAILGSQGLRAQAGPRPSP